jgi:peptidyl-prolyl cis-trans isomerase D
LPGVPTGVITAAFRTAKDGVGQTEASGGSQWIVFRVTDITVPAVDMASEDAKKLKDTLQRALNEEQSAQYVTRLEKDIGTTINEAALAQVVGGNNQ